MAPARKACAAIGVLGAAAGAALESTSAGNDLTRAAKENLLLQLNHQGAGQLSASSGRASSRRQLRALGCRAAPGAHSSVTDAACEAACETLPDGMWPCDESGVCTCSAETTTTTTYPTTTAAPTSAPSTSCRAAPGVAGAVSDAECAAACDYVSAGAWPCDESGVCTCQGGTTSAPTPNPMPPSPSPTPLPTPSPTPLPTPAMTTATTTPQTTQAPSATTTPASTTSSVVTTAPPVDDATVASLVKALQAADSTDVFMYDTGNGWLPSDIYTWPDMIKAVQMMATTGVGKSKLWSGFDGDHVYGLVNIAAFLAQCMQETIQYNACDENNWSDKAVVQEAGGSSYSSTAACGQLHQSYQDYTCSAEEDELANGQMACDVDPDMEMRATTQAGWYGVPAKLFCAPKSKVPKAPRWDSSSPWCAPEGGWGHVAPFADDVPLDEYFEYVNQGGSCKDYDGIKTGGWTFQGEGCVDGACPGSPAPLFGVPEGRTDVEGCCWWGRGVIQTTGVCNFGKLNYYIGKRAADEGRVSAFPQVDFCKNPGAICSPDGPSELKWVAGFFYWLNSVQPYSSGSWNYQAELKKWVDGGRQRGDSSFINGASGIVNRGCHNPPNCGTGELHGGAARINNFHKVLDAMGL
eukprot:TRINITY_DN432_c0_g1_i3.p1 TRINITY_DN432_c0_g1~~TRINITY_DN432_c0_g1_i3.p1  ORF type:complete len:655 (+),score=124.89 TRINITY_DN432_c0_g1_i3:59-1966(+)